MWTLNAIKKWLITPITYMPQSYPWSYLSFQVNHYCHQLGEQLCKTVDYFLSLEAYTEPFSTVKAR